MKPLLEIADEGYLLCPDCREPLEVLDHYGQATDYLWCPQCGLPRDYCDALFECGCSSCLADEKDARLEEALHYLRTTAHRSAGRTPEARQRMIKLLEEADRLPTPFEAPKGLSESDSSASGDNR